MKYQKSNNSLNSNFNYNIFFSISNFRHFKKMHNDNVEAPEIINNLDWYENMKFTDFFPNYGKHYRLSKMLAKESVKKRLEDVHRKSDPDGGMSYLGK